jgi:hypothetical protein
MNTHYRATLAFVGLAFIVAGCGDDSVEVANSTTTSTSIPAGPGSTGVPGTSTSTTSRESTTTVMSSSTTQAAVDELPDGDNFVLITSVDVAARKLTVDLAEIYTGAKALSEAAKDGATVDGEEIYIRNNNPKLRTVTVASSATIEVLDDGGAELSPSDLSGLSAALTDGRRAAYLKVSANSVTSIKQAYFP